MYSRSVEGLSEYGGCSDGAGLLALVVLGELAMEAVNRERQLVRAAAAESRRSSLLKGMMVGGV